MSRPHFMPFLALEAPSRWAGQPATRPATRVSAPAAAPRRGLAQITCLGVTTSLVDGRSSGLADAILRRVLRCGCPVGTVVLDLGAATTIHPGDCAAIVSVHERLTAIDTRLRLACGARKVLDALADGGVFHQLGRDAIHPSFRSAVLATYAELPGPGLVMGRVKAALETQAELIDP
jgi:hypothetical protein